MSKPVIYISGPMTGIPNFNFDAFNAAADRLRKLGYPVINPADFGVDGSQTWKDCLVRDLNALASAKILLTLPGWRNSRGSKLEVHVARAYEIEVYSLKEFLALRCLNGYGWLRGEEDDL